MAERPALPYVDLINFKGLFTKSSTEVVTAEQLRVAENCDYFQIYGAITKMRGSARVLASIYKENNVVKPISWIGFYKSSSLDGPLVRHTLAATGTKLSRIESDGTLTTLATGRSNNLFHSAAQLDRFLYLTNKDPDIVGVGDALVKYDGAVISKWGLSPPGSEETIRDAFDDASSWTTSNATLTDQLATTSGDVTFDGDAIQIDKSGTVDPTFTMAKDMDPAFSAYGDDRDSTDAIPNRIYFFTFIPRGSLTPSDLDSTTGFNQFPSISVWASPDTGDVSTNNCRFYFCM